MRLMFDPKPGPQWPHGYWYAITDDSGYDAVGATPLDAAVSLVEELETALNETKE